jgi:hypothetical protein
MAKLQHNEQDDDPDDAPETPLDEPSPPRVEDPPVEPAPVPYVVSAEQQPSRPENGGSW